MDTEALEHSNLLRLVVPTEKRRKGLVGTHQEYLTEGAVMLAYALHVRSAFNANRIELHPDGEHGKIFDFRKQLATCGYQFVSPLGSTKYGGVYRHDDRTEITVHPKAGLGDVVAYLPRGKIVAETKGGIVNTSHPGPTSRLRRGLCEAVGLLLATPVEEGIRQVAVVPNVAVTQRLAMKMVDRVRAAGISIALVDRMGKVTEIT